jgi:hypothetical protein
MGAVNGWDFRDFQTQFMVDEASNAHRSQILIKQNQSGVNGRTVCDARIASSRSIAEIGQCALPSSKHES